MAKRDRRDDISVSDDGNNSEYFSDDLKIDEKNVTKVARRKEKEDPYERILFTLSKLTDGVAFPRPEALLPEISADVKKVQEAIKLFDAEYSYDLSSDETMNIFCYISRYFR